MSFLFRGKMSKSPATYLFTGLFPNISRYLSSRPRHTTKQLTGVTSSTVSTQTQGVAVSDGGSTEKQILPKEAITEATIEERPPAEQFFPSRFISPHPLTNLADVPAIGGIQSIHVVEDDVFDPTRPLFLREAISPSLEPSEADAKSSSARRSFGRSAQAASTSQTTPKLEAKSSSAEGNFDMSANFDCQSRKRLNRHSLPTLPLSHSRNVSNSSNETLVWSPSGPSSPPSPVTSEFGQMLQNAYEQIIGEKLIDKVHGLEGIIQGLRLQLSDQTERAVGLETDLEICERDRQLNFNTALRLYRNSGNLASLERGNLMDQVNQLRFEVWDRDSQIWSRDELIEALRLDLAMYASHEQWLFLRRCFYALQQKYGQMPEDFRTLEQNYEDLEDMHIGVSDRFKKLEGDHTELKVQLDQVKDERNRLEDDAEKFKQSSAEASERYWALTAHCDQIIDQKADSERKARANEQLLAGLAARMFKRIIVMADVLDDMNVSPMDNEQITLCQLAYKYLGLDAAKISDNVEKAGVNGDKEIEEERDESDESDVPETHTGEASSSMSTSESTNCKPAIPVAGANDSSLSSVIEEKEMLESPDTFDARRRREVAAAEERILGPLGLGFDDGSPTLKARPIPESTKVFKVSKFMGLFPKSPGTPSKIWGGHLMSGADDIDQVTPARTGGTGGIARDQWAIAGNELHEFTEVFRGPRAQPIDIVSPGVETKGAEDGSRLKEEHFSQDSEVVISSTNEDFQDFNFGGSSGRVPFVGSENEPLALPIPPSEPTSTGLFNLSSTSPAQAPRNAYDPSLFEQDFNFGWSNGRVMITASSYTSSSSPARTPELESAGASSILGASLAQNQAEEKAPKEGIPDSNTIKNEGTEKDVSDPATSITKKVKGKKAKEEARKKKEEARKEEPRFEGPNRNQRRAASRERKAAEKKAQAEAKKATQRGRRAVTRAMLRG